jgi:hypothetical protein
MFYRLYGDRPELAMGDPGAARVSPSAPSPIAEQSLPEARDPE